MSWEAAMDYMNEYRKKRGPALNNEEPLRWFTAEVDSLSQLIDDKFGRDEENSKWEKEYDKKGKILKLQANALKVSMMSGMCRDLRTMYAASENNRGRSSVDHDRSEYMQAGFHLAKVDQLRNVIKAMEA